MTSGCRLWAVGAQGRLIPASLDSKILSYEAIPRSSRSARSQSCSAYPCCRPRSAQNFHASRSISSRDGAAAFADSATVAFLVFRAFAGAFVFFTVSAIQISFAGLATNLRGISSRIRKLLPHSNHQPIGSTFLLTRGNRWMLFHLGISSYRNGVGLLCDGTRK